MAAGRGDVVVSDGRVNSIHCFLLLCLCYVDYSHRVPLSVTWAAGASPSVHCRALVGCKQWFQLARPSKVMTSN